MAISIFDLFKIGIGPSSSHTVGPMKAACTFAQRLDENGLLGSTKRVRVSLYGSLAHTGRGHGTDKAVILGLQGELPDSVDPDLIEVSLERVAASQEINLLGRHRVPFNEAKDLVFRKRELLPYHPNGMRFDALDMDAAVLESRDYYSVGGGFVVSENKAAEDRIVADQTRLPWSFNTGDELLALCRQEGKRNPIRPAAHPRCNDGLHGTWIPPGGGASRQLTGYPAGAQAVPRTQPAISQR